MLSDKKMLEVLGSVTEISNNRKLAFQEKLNRILVVIADCLNAQKSSIMLIKNRKTLEVAASTNPAIIGVKQTLDADSPSTWVVNNKKPLYVDSSTRCECRLNRFKHYKGDAFFLVPIVDNDRVIGVMNVTEKLDRDTFDQKERKIFLDLVGNVITALETNRLAESLRKKQAMLQKRNLELKKLEKLRTELFNMLIHDLKGPISEIVANLDILSYALKGEQLDFVNTAQAGCNTLYHMISNLLDIARLEEGRLPLVYENIAPVELVREARARLLVSVSSKNIVFLEQIPEIEGRPLQGDRNLLVRVLQNLLTNAIQFSPRGENIIVGFDYSALKQIEFYVEDKGPGVPEQFREGIFDKYTQLNRSSDGRVYTTGLGLTFCRMAIEAHGGSIKVVSGEHRGSRFVFSLPLQRKATR